MPAREIDWAAVRRVLVIRLRSIGDTVLTTPSLIALKRFLPYAQIDILLESWVAPLLEGFDAVDNILVTSTSTSDKLRTVLELRRGRYDVVINLHGGTTATLFTAMSGAQHRIGFAGYQYSFLQNHSYPPAIDFWGRKAAHSAEQQLALLGYAGIPVEDRPKSQLAVTGAAKMSVDGRLPADVSDLALIHPAAAFAAKEWPTEKFARTAEFLWSEYGLQTVAVASQVETSILQQFAKASAVTVTVFNDLTLPEITALASRAKVFVGNDSGIAHIAAAVGIPVVVIFGPSNREHWYPWTEAANRIVQNQRPAKPCPANVCTAPGEEHCIHNIEPDQIFDAISEVLKGTKHENGPE